jgi:hypothetical protein
VSHVKVFIIFEIITGLLPLTIKYLGSNKNRFPNKNTYSFEYMYVLSLIRICFRSNEMCFWRYASKETYLPPTLFLGTQPKPDHAASQEIESFFQIDLMCFHWHHPLAAVLQQSCERSKDYANYRRQSKGGKRTMSMIAWVILLLTCVAYLHNKICNTCEVEYRWFKLKMFKSFNVEAL